MENVFNFLKNTHPIVNYTENDWYLQSSDQPIKGTTVVMIIGQNSSQTLKNVFARYTNHETFEFSKTEVLIKLSQFQQESFISRSQAKRVLFQLDKFKHIILDFKDVRVVGQGFVDEVFRVFHNKHPDIEISYCNANNDVEFMIKRSIPKP